MEIKHHDVSLLTFSVGIWQTQIKYTGTVLTRALCYWLTLGLLPPYSEVITDTIVLEFLAYSISYEQN